jgi:Holliday junction resolvase RusA-like endonuclease
MDNRQVSTMDTPATQAITRLSVWVPGRPAPKGSHKLGEHGQLRDASAYLAAWSGSWTGRGKGRRRVAGAVERAVYERYQEMGVEPGRLPLIRGPVGIQVTFVLDPSRRIDGPPDIDKLERATWDALTIARVWEDDARVVKSAAWKVPAILTGETGARIVAWAVTS